MAYRIEIDPKALDHMRALPAAQRSLLHAAVSVQLPHQPTVETRNRKRMRANIFGTWELRIRDLRVYYDVVDEPEQVVFVRGVGVKIRNSVYFPGEESE